MANNWEAGQRVRFFSIEKMDDVRGVIIKATRDTVEIQWDDEDCRRVYDTAHISGRGVQAISEEEDR